jgi:hypothetical protein
MSVYEGHRVRLLRALTVAIALCAGTVEAKAHTTGTFFLTSSFGLGGRKLANSFTTHEVDKAGIGFGFILPITRQRFSISYKGAVAFHGVTDLEYGSNPGPDDAKYYRNLDQYIASLNGLTVGTRLPLSDSVYIEPMLGLGVLVNIIYGNHGEGIAYGSFQVDLSALAMYELAHFDVGAFLSLGYVPLDGYLEQSDGGYLNVGLALAK